ncbi:hypothetical protein ANCCAN_24058 [Ancylostoma caninum]|uniref:Uncharacterized protein n=1 Tax=Ancylostoma caninum TaxID=29170 RepID=A0A368FH20_ANCCA|nr:hypothetical protein ANCCAN_24058 [Ancylostoma caninum]
MYWPLFSNQYKIMGSIGEPQNGASEVLDDWVRPTSGSSKNKNKKKKNKPATSEPASGAVTSSTPSPSKRQLCLLRHSQTTNLPLRRMGS